MSKSAAIQILTKNKEKAMAEAETDEVIPEETPEVEAEVEETPQPEEKPKAAAKKGKTTVTTTATKPKAAAKAKPVTISDEIADTASSIENLSESEALQELQNLLDAQAHDEFRIGGILAKIQTEGWFGEHPNFRTLVEAEYGIKYRTAMYWIGIYNDLVDSGVKWSDVKRLGWTKLKELSPILTPDNVKAILKAVEGMNALQVAAYASDLQANNGDVAKTEVPGEENQLKSKAFKLFPGQKESVELALEKAKKMSGTDSDSAALEFIAVDFMSGSKKPATKTKAEPTGDGPVYPNSVSEYIEAFKKTRESADDLQSGLMIALEALNEVFPEAQISVELEDEAD